MHRFSNLRAASWFWFFGYAIQPETKSIIVYNRAALFFPRELKNR